MVAGPAPALNTDPLLLEYCNRSGLARVSAGQLRALGPQSAGAGPHLSLIRAAFETGMLPVVDLPEEGGLQMLLDLGLEERLGVLDGLELGLNVTFEEESILMWAGAPRDGTRNVYRRIPVQLSVQPLVDAFGLDLTLELTRELSQVLSHHVGVWDVSDAQLFSAEAYEMDLDGEPAKEQLQGETAEYLRTHGLTTQQIGGNGPATEAYLDWIAEQYPRSALGHTHLFQHTLYREDWPEFSELSPAGQAMYTRFEARTELLRARFKDAYREGGFEEEIREDDENTGPPEEALLLMLDGQEGEFLLETWHDRAELYLNQRAPLIPPLLLVLDSANEPLDSRLRRLGEFLTSFELLDLSLKELQQSISEVKAWHAQVLEAGQHQTPLFPLGPLDHQPPTPHPLTFHRSPHADSRAG